MLGATNIRLSLMGLVCIYTGLIFIPITSIFSQDKEDYEVKEEETGILYIKFKKNEFLVAKETMEPSSFFFKDKNKKFVPLSRGYQIYNYVKNNF